MKNEESLDEESFDEESFDEDIFDEECSELNDSSFFILHSSFTLIGICGIYLSTHFVAR